MVEGSWREAVLVTGASSGIGEATVEALVRHGTRVWATVRRSADADRLAAAHGAAVRPLIMDLEDEESVRAAGATVVAEGPLAGLVNNAGAAFPGPLEFLSIGDFRRQLEVNLVGQLLVTQVMLPALSAAVAQRGEARVVMMGSIGGRVAGPMLGAYAAAKHGLVGLTGCLRAELAPQGIRVFLIEPGSIATPIWRKEGPSSELSRRPDVIAKYGPMLEATRDMARRGRTRGLPPGRVADAVLDALTGRNPRPRRVVGPDALVMAGMTRVLPFRVLYRLMGARR